jgi:predicted molibdopterin-dependent oxidoreductase YjgC
MLKIRRLQSSTRWALPNTITAWTTLWLANLSMITGNIGKSCAGVNPLRGQNNVRAS